MAEKPHTGGSDLLTQALDNSSIEVDETFLKAGMTGHPAEDVSDDDGGVSPADTSKDSGKDASEEPAEKSDEPRKYRYASQEEAEHAHAEAERKWQEESQRRAALEREAELYRQHAALMERQAQQAAKPAEPQTATEPKQAEPTEFNTKEHFKSAYKRMAELDPTSEDFESRQQEVFIDALDEALGKLRGSHTLTERQISERIETAITSALEAEKTRTAKVTESERLQAKLSAYATKHGLDLAPPTDENPFGGAHYRDVMTAIDRQMYPVEATEDEAIAHVVKLVQEKRGVKLPQPGSPSATDADARPGNTPSTSSPQRTQALNTPMARSGMGRPHQAQGDDDFPADKPVSLNAMVERSMRVRRP